MHLLWMGATLLAATAAGLLAWCGCRCRRRHERENEDLRTQVGELESAAERETQARTTLENERQWYCDRLRRAADIVLAYGVTEEDLPETFLDVSARACEVLGYSREALLALTPLDIEAFRQADLAIEYRDADMMTLDNPETLNRDSNFTRTQLQNIIRTVRREGRVAYDGAYITRTGRRLPVRVALTLTEKAGRPVVVADATDVTESLRMARTTRAAEQRCSDLLRWTTVGIAFYSEEGSIMDANQAFLKLLGLPDRDEFNKFDLLHNPMLPENVRRAIRRGNMRCDLNLDFDRILREGTFVSSRRGQAHFRLDISNLGMGEDYSPRGYVVQIQDVTAERELEAILDEREKQLQHAQKLEAIGALAGGIAHDFNNILTPILGYTDLGLDTCTSDDELRQFLTEIRRSTCRARELVHQILSFSRTDAASQPVHVVSIVKEVLKQVAPTLPPGISLRRDIKAEDDLVVATPTQIHQVLMNLISNGVDAMRRQGGTMTVRLSSFVLGGHHRKELPRLVTPQYLRGERRYRFLRISVRDEGAGMDEATRKRIFEPFFTTKPRGEGTGMGLAVVDGIVSSLGGGVSVESDPGAGTVFHVVLPLVDAPAGLGAEAALQTPLGRECVLFVDDEAAIVRMAELMLTSLGYRPVVTNQSVKALRLFEENPQRFDLVITDHVMPDLTGAELARKLTGIRPDVPVLLCTGFRENLSEEDVQAAGICEVLMKPVGRADLAQAIRRAFESGARRSGSATGEVSGFAAADDIAVGSDPKREPPGF